jgi:hypothetical protein
MEYQVKAYEWFKILSTFEAKKLDTIITSAEEVVEVDTSDICTQF